MPSKKPAFSNVPSHTHKPPSRRKVRKSSTAPDRVLSGIVAVRVALNAATPTLVFAADAGDAFKNLLVGFREIKNIDAAITIYLGDVNVSIAAGYPLAAGGAFNLSGAGRLFVGAVYAIAASGTPSCATIQY